MIEKQFLGIDSSRQSSPSASVYKAKALCVQRGVLEY